MIYNWRFVLKSLLNHKILLYKETLLHQSSVFFMPGVYRPYFGRTISRNVVQY